MKSVRDSIPSATKAFEFPITPLKILIIDKIRFPKILIETDFFARIKFDSDKIIYFTFRE